MKVKVSIEVEAEMEVDVGLNTASETVDFLINDGGDKGVRVQLKWEAEPVPLNLDLPDDITEENVKGMIARRVAHHVALKALDSVRQKTADTYGDSATFLPQHTPKGGALA